VQPWYNAGVDFPILTLLNTNATRQWIEHHFHPGGFGCPYFYAHLNEAGIFSINRGSDLPVYRCRACRGVYTLYSRMIF
jgi:hypothetical protein